jgi:hypothetical protein
LREVAHVQAAPSRTLPAFGTTDHVPQARPFKKASTASAVRVSGRQLRRGATLKERKA